MTGITFAHQLPFVSVLIHAKGQKFTVHNVLLDTGSAATIFRTDLMEEFGVGLEPTDRIREMVGIGGSETVIEKRIEAVEVGELIVRPFTIQYSNGATQLHPPHERHPGDRVSG